MSPDELPAPSRPVIQPGPGRRVLVAALAAGLLAAACSGESDDGGDDVAPPPGASAVDIMDAPDLPAATTPTAEAPTGPAAEADDADDPTAPSFLAQPGPGQLAVRDVERGAELTLRTGDGDDGDVVATQRADRNGAVLFRDVEPGRYRLVDEDGRRSEAITVPALTDDAAPALYTQTIEPGFGYLETRDGTTLSVNVALPGPVDAGPYPTVVEYSGYQPSSPAQTTPPRLFNALGYAYVGVNMRGTGCSGGSFSFFEPVQALDGYDVVETVAAQPWARGHKVGMVGLSYPGIAQLYVAAARPPSLAAITPLAVVADFVDDVFFPGGIPNPTFAEAWAGARDDESRPEGQAWAAARIAMGDERCDDNQELRLQNTELRAALAGQPFWTEDLAGPLAPRLFVDRIDVPVFLAGTWQDEQTSSRFVTMLDRFTGTDHVYATLVNGLHIDPMSTGVFPRLIEFLDLYVAERVPTTAGADRDALAAGVFGAGEVELPPDRFAAHTYDEARAWFENEPPIQVLFEQGAADGQPEGTPVPRWSAAFFEWPIATTDAQAWHLGPGELRSGGPPPEAGSVSYRADPDALPATFHDQSSGSSWAYDVEWQWREPPPGTAATFDSSPLAADTALIGSASADLWIRSSAPDTDLEVTLSEIRRDGDEVYVQSGWLRASHRFLDAAATTVLRPVATHLEADAAPLPVGEWTLVRVEILPFAHAVREGSRLRLSVDAPGNARASWTFSTIADGETVEIGWGPDRPSQLVLPVIPGVDIPDELPSCTLRGQPCR